MSSFFFYFTFALSSPSVPFMLTFPSGLHKWKSDTASKTFMCAMLTAVVRLFHLYKLYLAFSLPSVALNTPPGISPCPLTFNEVHFLCNCTHTRYGMNAGFANGGIYFYAPVCALMSINVMNIECTLRSLVKVKVLSWWKFSLPSFLCGDRARIHKGSGRSIT